MEFQTAYEKLNTCLTDYVRLKKESGWVEKVRAFQKITMLIIKETNDIEYLKTKVQELSDSLCSTVNWLTGGKVGGSTLKINLENLLDEIRRPPALVIPAEVAVSPLESPDWESSCEDLVAALESPPSSTDERAPSLPPSPLSVTSCLADRSNPFTYAYRNIQDEQFIKNQVKYQCVGPFALALMPKDVERRALFAMKYD